jgi:GcrA cell cycle regulator
MAWTQPKLDRLRVLLGEKKSASEIAAIISAETGHVSRNAVIGICFRKGMQLPGEPSGGPRRPRRDRGKPRTRVPQPTPKPHLNGQRAPAAYSAPLPPLLTPEADLAIPEACRRTLFQLTANTCRWPVGDPGEPSFFFCGAQVALGEVYCHGHCLRAWAVRSR